MRKLIVLLLIAAISLPLSGCSGALGALKVAHRIWSISNVVNIPRKRPVVKASKSTEPAEAPVEQAVALDKTEAKTD